MSKDLYQRPKGLTLEHSVLDYQSGCARTMPFIYSDANEGLIRKATGTEFFNIPDTGDDDILLLTPPDPDVIQSLGVALIGEGNFWRAEFREAPNINDVGPTKVNGFNLNRRLPDAHKLLIYDDPDITDGVLLDEGLFGGSTGQGNQSGTLGEALFFNGWIFKPSTYYQIRIVNLTGAAAGISVDFLWKESLLNEK
jgi:hypothetical protein